MKHALITGASSGIGEAFARLLATRDYHVVLVARRKDRLQQLADEIEGNGGSATAMVADLVSQEGLEQTRTFIHENQLDLLINNAGFGVYSPAIHVDEEQEQDMIQLNVNALVSLTRTALPQMIRRNSGGIIQIASTASFLSTPYMAGYGATKAFVLHYSEALAMELRGTGVTVTTVCPGSTESEFATQAGFRQPFAKPAKKVAVWACLRGKKDVL